MSEFIRPQVQVEETNETSARVSVEPLERGYGDTLGNSLRRVLLSSRRGCRRRGYSDRWCTSTTFHDHPVTWSRMSPTSS
mgnify:CR=1 FL=1